MIYILREQVPNSSTANLSLAGQHNSRLFAEALQGFITSGVVLTHRPSTDVTNPQRMHNLPQLAYQTASSIAIALGLRLECYTNLRSMVEQILKRLRDPKRSVLIVWPHDCVNDLINELMAVRGIDPLDEPVEWDDDDYFSCITIDDSEDCDVEMSEVIDGVMNDRDIPSTMNEQKNKPKAHVQKDDDEEEEDEDDEEEEDEDDEEEEDDDEDEEKSKNDEDEEEDDEDEEEDDEDEEEDDEDEDEDEEEDDEEDDEDEEKKLTPPAKKTLRMKTAPDSQEKQEQEKQEQEKQEQVKQAQVKQAQVKQAQVKQSTQKQEQMKQAQEKQSTQKQSTQKQSTQKQSGRKQAQEQVKQAQVKQAQEKQEQEKQAQEKQSGKKQAQEQEKQSTQKQSTQKQSTQKQAQEQEKQAQEKQSNQKQLNKRPQNRTQKKSRGGQPMQQPPAKFHREQQPTATTNESCVVM